MASGNGRGGRSEKECLKKVARIAKSERKTERKRERVSRERREKVERIT